MTSRQHLLTSKVVDCLRVTNGTLMHRQLLLKIGKCKYDMCLDWRRFIVSFKRKDMFCCSRGLDHGLMLVKFSENCWLHETFCMKLNCAYRNINAIDMIAIQRHIEYLKLLVIFRKNDFNRIENPDRDLFHGENKSIREPVINGSWNIVTSLTKTKQWIFFWWVNQNVYSWILKHV